MIVSAKLMLISLIYKCCKMLYVNTRRYVQRFDLSKHYTSIEALKKPFLVNLETPFNHYYNIYHTMKNYLLLLFAFILSFTGYTQSQAPDFTMDDLNGNTHSLYADYLDQGKTVFISIGAAWNIWDTTWIGTGVMNDFHATYVGNDAVLLFIEADPFTEDMDLYGGGQYFDIVTGNDYPIINAPGSFVDDYEVAFYPSIRVICPDGSMYSDAVEQDMGWGAYETSDDIALKMFEKCGTLLLDNTNGIVTTVFQDDNADCIYDASVESYMPDIAVEVSGANGTITRYTNDAGISNTIVPTGTFDVSAIAPNSLWNTCNSPQTVIFPNVGDIEEVNLGIEPEIECTLLSTTVGCPWLRRCFESNIYIEFCNEGTEASTSTLLDVILDEHLEYISANYPLLGQNGQTLTFDIGTLNPWECGKIVLVVVPDCDVDLGTLQCIQSFIYPTEDCDSGDFHSDRQCSEIVGAYDPNDKRAFPLSGSDEYRILPDATIRYMIRFQNSGTDTAFNIVILDEISENMNLSTFRKISSSHDCYAEINEDRELRFFFDNIMLPDSNVNLIGSNGFVSFTMSMVDGLVNDDVITNEADIFFDFNDPIRTNTTTHIVDDGISSTDDIELYDFRISPNPVANTLIVELEKQDEIMVNAQILGIDGRQLREVELDTRQSKLDVSQLSNGIYFIKISDREGTNTIKKFIVQR